MAVGIIRKTTYISKKLMLWWMHRSVGFLRNKRKRKKQEGVNALEKFPSIKLSSDDNIDSSSSNSMCSDSENE